MELYTYIVISFNFLHVLSAVNVIKRKMYLPIEKDRSLTNPYTYVQLSSNSLVLCGLLCTEDDRCVSSSISLTDYKCELFDNPYARTIVDTNKILIYQPQEIETTTIQEIQTTAIIQITTTEATTFVASWPKGTYTLMKPLVGCPGNDVDWKEGSRYHDTEDNDRFNGYVISSNMLVDQDTFHNIRVHFCTKDTTSDTENNWPAGNYCILKYVSCPTGFTSGYIRWDDEDTGSANTATGTLPTGVYNLDTKVFYCCRNDGSDATEIRLPTSDPFYLLRYTGNCQSVKAMTVSEETIKWDCQDGGFKDIGTVHPFEDGPNSDIILHFCYYT